MYFPGVPLIFFMLIALWQQNFHLFWIRWTQPEYWHSSQGQPDQRQEAAHPRITLSAIHAWALCWEETACIIMCVKQCLILMLSRQEDYLTKHSSPARQAGLVAEVSALIKPFLGPPRWPLSCLFWNKMRRGKVWGKLLLGAYFPAAASSDNQMKSNQKVHSWTRPKCLI